jgi:hypothetical protein
MRCELVKGVLVFLKLCDAKPCEMTGQKSKFYLRLCGQEDLCNQINRLNTSQKQPEILIGVRAPDSHSDEPRSEQHQKHAKTRIMLTEE